MLSSSFSSASSVLSFLSIPSVLITIVSRELTFGIRFVDPIHARTTPLNSPTEERLRCHGPFKELYKQIHAEIKDGFTVHEVTFTKRLDEVHAAEQIRDACISNLEDTTATLEKSFGEWSPEVDTSITSIRLELTKLNSFDRDARAASSTQPVVIPVGSASARSSPGANADGPVGHRVETSNRDGGFGRVFTHTHIPVTGMMPQTTPPPFTSVHTDPGRASQSSADFRLNLGKLPKMNFPRFDGDHPKLWQSRCKNYFDMYSVDPCMWVRVASMHFDGPAMRWL
jgi:hypothetical protein